MSDARYPSMCVVEARPVAIFVGDELLGQFMQERIWANPAIDRFISYSRAYFCPQCGEVWARMLVAGAKFSHPVLRYCEKHYTRTHPDAGLLLEGMDFYLEWPDEVYYRELRLLAERDEWWQGGDVVANFSEKSAPLTTEDHP